MGRTVPSYRLALEEEIKSWEGFKKALQMEDAEAFELMMNACRSQYIESVRLLCTETQ